MKSFCYLGDRICGDKLTEKKNIQELKSTLVLEENLDKLANANRVQWCGRILRKNRNDELRKVLDFKMVEGRRGLKNDQKTSKRDAKD